MKSRFVQKPFLKFLYTLLLLVVILPLSVMAQPSFRTVIGSPTDGNSNRTTPITITPSEAIQEGDLIVVYAHCRANETLSISGGGQTWNTATSNNNGSTQRFAVFWCEFNGAWTGGNFLVSRSGSGNTTFTAVMYVFKPDDPNNVWDIHIGATNNSVNGTAISINGRTTTEPNTVTMAFWGSPDDNTWSGTLASGWSKSSLPDQWRNMGRTTGGSSNGDELSHTAAYNIQASAATIIDVSQTQSVSEDGNLTSIITWYEAPPPPPPANDECANAISLTANSSCNNTSGTLSGAGYTAMTVTGGFCGSSNNDVWYSFVANVPNQTITLSSAPSNSRIQLFSGTCAGLTSIGCSSGTTYAATGLTPGNTYYIRVYSTSNATGNFNICVTEPTPADIEYAKSYANITKISGGGNITPGDELEIRATLVVKKLTVDSLMFIDTLKPGLSLVPGSIVIRTNEGKVYDFNPSTTDGYSYVDGGYTLIRLNIGQGSSDTKRGKLRAKMSGSSPAIRPSFGDACIVMATYRVTVSATYGTTLDLGGGYFTARDSATGEMKTLNLAPRKALVYESPGLCPNALSPANVVADEYSGTFGSPLTDGTTPFTNTSTNRLYKNRYASSSVPSYIDTNFTVGSPQDYYYGIVNNTSADWTTTNTWLKKDAGNRRVHQLWDITGDHTGAADPAKGNPPCDTTQAVSASNPCGYMLVVNSSYKTDTSFQYNISNLCSNTYYEISFWVKNMCSKCGADSTGKTVYNIAAGVHTPGVYIPFEPNDSSGVQPNLAIDINGVDYYTTGHIRYAGTDLPQEQQDDANIWVKRGFTYFTGDNPGTLTMSIRNTAPGGGGNDWALDDIAVATCYPTMIYSPSSNPSVCEGNVLEIADTIRSFFDNYTEFKWQRSTDAGATWADVTGVGSETPIWNGSEYEFHTTYTIAPTETMAANAGDMYRVVVASNPFNLGDEDCAYSDPTTITLDVLTDCGPVLSTNLLSVNGVLNSSRLAEIKWTTSKEEEPIYFELERSDDGRAFTRVATVQGWNNGQSVNYYTYVDPEEVRGRKWYRIVMISSAGTKKYSRVVQLNSEALDFAVENLVNPFGEQLQFNVISSKSAKVTVDIISLQGKIVKSNTYLVNSGTSLIRLAGTDVMASGIYTLRVQNGEKVINKKVIKRNN